MTKFRKRVIAIVMVMMMVISSISMAFASTTTNNTGDNSATYAQSAQTLKGYGVFVGDGNGNLMLDQPMKRQDAVIMSLRLMGVKDSDFENYQTNSDFTDISDSYYLPIIGMAEDLGLVQGMGDGTFGFNQLMKAQDLETLLIRALGYEVNTDEEYANVPAQAQQLGIANLVTAANGEFITRDKIAQLMLNTLNTNMKDDTKTLGETLGITTQQPATGDYSITAKVAAEDAMEVTFNQAVADTSKVSFSVTGAMTVTPTVSWNDAKTIATLKSPGIFIDGTYTVKASGLTFAEGKDTATVTVAKNGIAKIEILGDKLVRTGDNTGEVKIKLTDFYGNDVTEKMAYDVTLNSSRAGSVAIKDAKKGIVEVTATTDWTNYPAVPELVQLTAYAKTAVNGTVATASSTLTVTELSRVDKVTLGNVVLPTGYTKLTMEKANAGYIVVNAVDQFGREVTDTNLLERTGINSEVFYSISNSNVGTSLTTETNANSQDEIRMNIDLSQITNKNDARPVTLQLISKYKGTASNTVTLDIKQGKAPYRVTMGSLEQVVAVDDNFTDGVAVIPLNVYDEDGVQLTPDEIADHASDFTVTNPTGFNFAIATTGVNKGKLVATTAPGTKGMYSVMLQINNATTAPANMTIDVKDKAEVRSVRLAATPATNLLYNATSKMKYEFVDQYGRVMSDAMLGNLDPDSDGYVTEARVSLSDTTKASATANSVAVTTNGILVSDLTDITAKDSVQITAAQKSGTSTLKVEIVKVDTAHANAVKSILSTDSRTFTIADGVPSSLTFTIDTVPTLDMIDTASNVNTGFGGNGHGYNANNYVKEVTVSAKDANGNSFAVPYDRILSVASSDTTVAIIVKDTVSNKIMIAGTSDALNADAASTTKSATITLQIGTDTEAKTISGTVSVSKQAPVAQQVLFIDKPLAGGATDTDLPDNYKEVKEVTLNDGAQFYVVYKDQYGVYHQLGSDQALTLVNSDKAAVGTIFNYNATNTNLDNVNTLRIKSDSTLVLMYSKDGASGTINVRTGSIGQIESDQSFDTTPASVSAAMTQQVAANGGTRTITFSEEIASASRTAIQNAINGAKVQGTLGFNWNAAGTVLTITNSDGANDTAFAADLTVNNVADMAGNTANLKVIDLP